jgi:peptidoglycan/xylan/chitin deacetylase (PgdA/CDA1 family)
VSVLRSHLFIAALSLGLNIANIANAAEPAPVRFLLTFDDGPAAASDNPTVRILDVLARNAVQDNVKAVFFVQTRAWHGGGTQVGRGLIRREFDAGHVVALHSATPLHANHLFMSATALAQNMENGVADLIDVTGVAPRLVRPTFWAYNAETIANYHAHGMQMMLTDLSANDGKIYGVNFSWHKRSNLLAHLAETRVHWAAGTMPVSDGVTPVVVTFHDVNTYTSRNIEEYMRILLDVAQELHVPLADKPFYDDHDELERAALAVAVKDPKTKPRLPGFWNFLWQ